MRKTIFIATLLIAVPIFTYGVWYYIQKNEALHTGINYFFDDIGTRHTEDGLIIGSSTLRYMNQSRYLNCGMWLNRGIGNAEIPTLRRYLFFSPLSIYPKRILVYAGENDISHGTSPERTAENYIQFLSLLREKYQESELHVMAIKPSPTRKKHWNDFYRVNKIMETHILGMENAFFHPTDWAETFFSSSLSFTEDGIHLSDEGYIVFVKGINELCP